MSKLRYFVLVALAVLFPGIAQADQRCAQCGCNAGCRAVCVPKKIEKEITKVCWDYRCEDVCIPGRSKCIATRCAEDKCGCYTYDDAQPTCARVKTRHIPVKIEVKRKVPAIEWKIEYRCDACCVEP